MFEARQVQERSRAREEAAEGTASNWGSDEESGQENAENPHPDEGVPPGPPASVRSAKKERPRRGFQDSLWKMNGDPKSDSNRLRIITEWYKLSWLINQGPMSGRVTAHANELLTGIYERARSADIFNELVDEMLHTDPRVQVPSKSGFAKRLRTLDRERARQTGASDGASAPPSRKRSTPSVHTGKADSPNELPRREPRAPRKSKDVKPPKRANKPPSDEEKIAAMLKRKEELAAFYEMGVRYAQQPQVPDVSGNQQQTTTGKTPPSSGDFDRAEQFSGRSETAMETEESAPADKSDTKSASGTARTRESGPSTADFEKAGTEPPQQASQDEGQNADV